MRIKKNYMIKKIINKIFKKINVTGKNEKKTVPNLDLILMYQSAVSILAIP